MKPYKQGFVVGKFCPPHIGHEYLIRTALSQCDQVFLLSYTSEHHKRLDTDTRRFLLNYLFKNEVASGKLHIVVTDQILTPSMPFDSSSALQHRHFCAEMYLKYQGYSNPIDAVFTSEDYGDGLAEALSSYWQNHIEHVEVDLHRKVYSVSGTQVRDLVEQDCSVYDKVSPIVAKALKKRILILGGESSGKTTLSILLSQFLDCPWAPEYGRELYDTLDGELTFDDMEHIASVQSRREILLADDNSPWVVCDTSPLTTYFYSIQLFNDVSQSLEKKVNMTTKDYDYIFICENDIPFVQDGTRKDDTFRETGKEFYVDWLTQEDIPFTIVSGNFNERVKQVLKVINA